MSVDLRIMRYVVAVADEGGFHRAAERLHMAQPPLSRQVRALEDKLGVPLFERRPTQLTEAGRVFVESARRVLADADRMVEHTIAAGRGEFGVVNLGYIPTAAYDTLPRLIAELTDQYPSIRIEAQEGWSTALESGLRGEQFDIILGRFLPVCAEFARQTLRRERFVAMVGTTHPLAQRDVVALRDFQGEIFRFFPRHLAPDYYDSILAALHQTGETFEVWENPVPGLRHLDALVERGFTLVPESAAAGLRNGTVGLPLLDKLPTMDLELVWRSATLSPIRRRLTEAASQLAVREHWLPPLDTRPN